MPPQGFVSLLHKCTGAEERGVKLEGQGRKRERTKEFFAISGTLIITHGKCPHDHLALSYTVVSLTMEVKLCFLNEHNFNFRCSQTPVCVFILLF